jgi:hypothetical protein
MKEKIDILRENYDELPDQGKDELLTIGEKYLNESENEKLKLKTEKIEVDIELNIKYLNSLREFKYMSVDVKTQRSYL